MKRDIEKILLYIIFVAAIFIGGFIAGHYQAKIGQDKKEFKEIKTVVKKNDDLQVVSNKAEEATVVYKDRVVTKYQTITKEVVKYVEKENSSSDIIWLDANWVRVHDDAVDAANSFAETSGPTVESNDRPQTAEKIGVKSGEALKIIAENYQAAAECRIELNGWQEFYRNLQKEMNTK